MAVANTTKLEAVNDILRNIGVSPVNSLTGTSNLNVQNALSELENTSRAVLLRGWKFNTVDSLTINPTINDELLVPLNALDIVNNGGESIVPRGTRFYDTENGTFTITEALDATVVQYLEWEELPETARQYIKIRAGRVLQEDTVSSQTLSSYDRADEADALIELRVAEERDVGGNVLTSQTAQRILTRNRVLR